MVLDFTEVFRCAVDHFVLAWIAPEGPQQADYYYRAQDGCRLSRPYGPRRGAGAPIRGANRLRSGSPTSSRITSCHHSSPPRHPIWSPIRTSVHLWWR
jgi:hypothetical protein